MEYVGKEPSYVYGTVHGPGYLGAGASAARTGTRRTRTSPTPSTPTRSTGSRARSPGADGTLCLDVPWAKTHDGNPAQVVDCNGNAAQDWTRGTDGTVRALGKCLDVAGGATEAGTRVQLWSCNRTKAQRWTYDTTTGALRNPQSGKCLDAEGGLPLRDGQRVVIWTCHGGANQRWVL